MNKNLFKIIKFNKGIHLYNNNLAQIYYLQAVQIIEKAAKSTLGPGGSNACIENDLGLPRITKDGVTVVKNLKSHNNAINLVFKLFQQVAHSCNEYCGDGTTTGTILATSIYLESMKYLQSGGVPVMMNKGIKKALKETQEFINLTKKELQQPYNEKQLFQISQIATNYDNELSQLLTDFFIKLGPDSVHLVELNNKYENELHIVQGLQLLRGVSSEGFYENKMDSWIIKKNPYILTLNYEVKSLQMIHSILQYCKEKKTPLVIVCLGMKDELLQQLIVSYKKKFYDVLVIDMPLNELYKSKELIEDLSILSNSNLLDDIQVSLLKDLTPSDLGQLHQVKQNHSELNIIASNNKTIQHKERIQKHLDQLSYDCSDVNSSIHRQQFLKVRMHHMKESIGIFKIGGTNKTIQNRNHDILVDGLNSVKNCILKGIIPGGGSTLLYASNLIKDLPGNNIDEQYGIQIFHKALQKPFQYILENAGLNGKYQAQKLINDNNIENVFDVRTQKIGNFEQLGIIDSGQNLISILNDAVSISTLLLNNGFLITNDKVYFPSSMKDYKHLAII